MGCINIISGDITKTVLEISRFLEEDNSVDKVFMVCFDEGIMEAYTEVMKDYNQSI